MASRVNRVCFANASIYSKDVENVIYNVGLLKERSLYWPKLSLKEITFCFLLLLGALPNGPTNIVSHLVFRNHIKIELNINLR